MHPLDSPYPPILLTLIREHLHKNVVRKLTTFTREEYLIVFDERDEVEVRDHTLKFQAGKPFSVCLCVSPLDGQKVEQMTRRAFNMPATFLSQFLRYYSIVKKSDAVALYGIEVQGEPTALDLVREQFKRYAKVVTHEVFTTVRITDTETGKSVAVKAKNGNAFDLECQAIRILRNQ